MADDPFQTHGRGSEQRVSGPGPSASLGDVRNNPFLTHQQGPQRPPSQLMPAGPAPQSIAPRPMANAAPPIEAPPPQEPPQELIIPEWYPAENNWAMCRERMDANFRQINEEFTGQWSEQQVAMEASRMEKLGDVIHQKSGGKVGPPRQQKLRTANVVDVYQDWRFPGDATAWFRGGESKDFHTLPSPFKWLRLMEFSLDPYPLVDLVPGAYLPKAGRVYQGQLEDFYLVAALQTVGMKPQLIANIFANSEFSNPRLGAYTLRLYKHGQWQYVDIDDRLPFDKEFNPICATSEYWPDFAWPALIEKAYAKLHGSWESLSGGGHIEEVLTDLTGGCASRFGTTDVAPDRLWQYIHQNMNWCVFGCNINEAMCSKRSVPLEKHWACSIFRTAKHEGVPYICVLLAAPVSTVRHLPTCDIPGPEGYGPQDGFAWLNVDDFVSFFDIVYECRLVNSDLGPWQMTGIPYSPGWVVGYPWFEELWAYQGDVYTETAPSFLLDIRDAPNELTLEASQTDVRYSDPHEDHDEGRPIQAPLLLRFYQCSREVTTTGGGEIYLVHLSAWGHTRDACTAVKVMKPGKYLAMVSIPARYTCHRMIFRCYSTRPLSVQPITQHRSFVPVCPAKPLDAMPYSLAGFMRVDSYSEKFPQMFNEAEGRGMPMANPLHGSLTRRGSRRNQEVLGGWQREMKQTLETMPFGNRKKIDGMDLVGKFGGKDSYATLNANEGQQGGCSLM